MPRLIDGSNHQKGIIVTLNKTSSELIIFHQAKHKVTEVTDDKKRMGIEKIC